MDKPNDAVNVAPESVVDDKLANPTIDLTIPSDPDKYEALQAEAQAALDALKDLQVNGNPITNDRTWDDEQGSSLPSLGDTMAQDILNNQKTEEEPEAEVDDENDIEGVEQEVLNQERDYAAQIAATNHYQQMAYQNQLLQQQLNESKKQLDDIKMAESVAWEQRLEEGLRFARIKVDQAETYEERQQNLDTIDRLSRALNKIEMDKRFDAFVRAQQEAQGGNPVGQMPPFINPLQGQPIPGQPTFAAPTYAPPLPGNPYGHNPQMPPYQAYTHPMQPFTPPPPAPAYVHPLAAVVQTGLPSKGSGASGAPRKGNPGGRVSSPSSVDGYNFSDLEEASFRNTKYPGIADHDIAAKKKAYVAFNNLKKGN